MKPLFKNAAILLVALLLSACAALSNPFSNPFKESKKSSDKTPVGGAAPFVEPQTKASTGLTRVWKESIARTPGKHQQQPAQFMVTDADLFVGTFQGRLLRLDRERGRPLWEVTVGEQVAGGVGVDEQRVFVGTRNGEMVALSRENGQELWRTTLSAPVDSAPAVGKGRVIFTTLDNHTYALNSADGKRLWSHSTPPETLVVMGSGTPTVDGNVVYVGYASGDLFALSLENGAPLWADALAVTGGRTELELLQDVDASVVVSQEREGPTAAGMKKLFAVNHQGRAVAVLPRNGARVWEHKLSAVHRPWLAGQQLFFADMSGAVVALSAGEGIELWRTPVSDGLLTGPVLHGSKVLVADNRGRLIALDPATGSVLGMDRLGETFLADPVVAGNSLFLWSNEGNVQRYDF
ncbi:MAG: outer membrane protein assembly factor BamB [Magnetococcales bacterium]|nr:outer membrane protein assembly factor BamB [Magnetococcales bacterium]